MTSVGFQTRHTGQLGTVKYNHNEDPELLLPLLLRCYMKSTSVTPLSALVISTEMNLPTVRVSVKNQFLQKNSVMKCYMHRCG